jgi:hypothetical protein
MATKVKLTNVRLTFPQLFEAASFDGLGKKTFNASFLIDPKDPQVKAINAAIDAEAEAKWGAKAAATLKTMRATDKVALHDGDLKAQFAGYEGMLYVNSSSVIRPLVLDQKRAPLTAEDGKPYGGCYVNASVELWAQDNQFGKRINATLQGVQFVKDGDAFAGGSAASEDDFDDISSGADADSLV